jgi:cell division septal protein FtsQ
MYLKYIGLFLIFASSYILLYSPYFLISPSKVLIEGLDEGIDISVAYRSIEELYGENIFFIDEAKVALSLKKYQQNISLIRIDRLYPNNIKILLS